MMEEKTNECFSSIFFFIKLYIIFKVLNKIERKRVISLTYHQQHYHYIICLFM